MKWKKMKLKKTSHIVKMKLKKTSKINKPFTNECKSLFLEKCVGLLFTEANNYYPRYRYSQAL